MVLAAGLACGTITAEDKGNYLAVSGPKPLRFQAVLPQYDPASVLPPLDMGDRTDLRSGTNVTDSVKASASPVNEISQLPPEPPAESQSIIPDLPAQPAQPASFDPVNLPEPKPATSQLTPQMLLRYFPGDGNKEVLVPAGVDFTPPAPATPPGRSSATYTSPPAK